MIIEKNILKADEGKVLTNGETLGTTIYLGKNDSTNNWHEVDETEYLKSLEESKFSIWLGSN
jgi:hypothetical protein